jgi:hypothetical protein
MSALSEQTLVGLLVATIACCSGCPTAAAAGEVGVLSDFVAGRSGVAKWWDVVISPIMDDQRPAARLLAVSRT